MSLARRERANRLSRRSRAVWLGAVTEPLDEARQGIWERRESRLGKGGQSAQERILRPRQAAEAVQKLEHHGTPHAAVLGSPLISIRDST